MNWVQDMSQKLINRWVLISFEGSPHVYQAPKNGCFTAARAIMAQEALFNL